MSGHALEGEVEETARNWLASASAYAAALKRGESPEIAVRLHRSPSAGDEAAEADRKAADLLNADPKDLAFTRYLGGRALSAKDWLAAEAHYRFVVALQPGHAAALNNIVWLLATQHKPGAVAMPDRANVLMSDRAGLLDTLSFSQEAENQVPQTLQKKWRAVGLDPKDPALRRRLAKLRVKQGNKSDARTELETLARQGTSFAGQAEVLALLKSLQAGQGAIGALQFQRPRA